MAVPAQNSPADRVEPANDETPPAHGEPKTFTLKNGLDVVVIPDHRAPVVTHMVWYRVGAADEPLGKSGLAHFLEHLMFKGTETIPPGKFSKIVARHGGEDNAFTWQDYTAYYQRVAKTYLPLVMEMEADRMVNLTLTDAEVLPERDVILEERRTRVENDPGSLLAERMSAVLYGGHPYGDPVIGWPEEIAKLTTEDAIAFYKTYYAPNNAILIVAGDVTQDEVRRLAEKYYGALPPSEGLRPRQRSSVPERQASERVMLADARVQQPVLRRTYLAPSYGTDKPGESEAVAVMAEILGGGTTSRLYRALVVEQEIAVAAGAWHLGDALDGGRLSLYAIPKPDVSLEALEEAMDRVLADIKADGVTADELARAKTSLIAAITYQRDSQQSLAYQMGSALTTGGTVADVLEWPCRVDATSAEDVQAAARTVLEPKGSVTGYLMQVDEAS